MPAFAKITSRKVVLQTHSNRLWYCRNLSLSAAVSTMQVVGRVSSPGHPRLRFSSNMELNDRAHAQMPRCQLCSRQKALKKLLPLKMNLGCPKVINFTSVAALCPLIDRSSSLRARETAWSTARAPPRLEPHDMISIERARFKADGSDTGDPTHLWPVQMTVLLSATC